MEIRIGNNAGFCFGVKRAVEGSIAEVSNSNQKVYCLGELVHNNEVINRIREAGITIVSSIDEINEENVKLIIRAHGVDKKLYEQAKERNIEIIDFTCPLVARIHNIAEKYKNESYYIFLIGNRVHPEIIGTASHCGEHYFIIESEMQIDEAVNSFLSSNIQNLLVISQTTYSETKFERIIQDIRSKLTSSVNLVVKNTICNATSIRQKEVQTLSKEVELMIIIGGKNSSNTKKLYELSKENTNAIMIENAKELDKVQIKQYERVGIMAGTSTPQDSIDRVVEFLKR